MQLSTSMRNALANAFDELVNTGSGTAALTFKTSADTVCAVCPLQPTAFQDASIGVITLDITSVSDSSANAGGIIQYCELTDQNSNVVATLGCETAGGSADISLSSTSINVGETLTVSSLTVTVPAGSIDTA